MFSVFADNCLLSLNTKEQQAEAIMWFHLKDTDNSEISLATINQYFEAACLPKLNVTRAKASFAKSRNVCKGSKSGLYKLTLPAVVAFEKEYGYLWEKEPQIEDAAGISETPYLSSNEIDQARKMA